MTGQKDPFDGILDFHLSFGDTFGQTVGCNLDDHVFVYSLGYPLPAYTAAGSFPLLVDLEVPQNVWFRCERHLVYIPKCCYLHTFCPEHHMAADQVYSVVAEELVEHSSPAV